MRYRSQLVGILWHWHRRLGIFAAVFVVVLAASGIVLNHSAGLGLDRSFVDWPWLSKAYGDTSADLPAFNLGERWLSRAANGRIYLDDHEVASCNGKLVGALRVDQLFYAGCAEQLLLITEAGELVESISASTGLPVPLEAIGRINNQVAVKTGEGWWLADLDRLDFSERAPVGEVVIRELFPDQLPDAIRDNIPAQEQWLTWERLLLDLHSGRLLGTGGVVFVDGVGVLLGSLAMSGTAMWWLHRRRKQKP